MVEKVVDLISYKIEKSLKENGFIVKRDKGENIKLLIKINEEE
jgi:predicted RNA binding protein YcfA (HicA-like mRNA interferase family)